MKKLMILPVMIALAILLIVITDNSNEVRISVDGGTIYGTLLKPSENAAGNLAIIIAGSGPTDRDGNTPLIDGKNDSLKALAYSLKEHNIASFRYDKRNSGKSGKHMNSKTPDFTLFVDDLVSCIQYLKQTESYKNIYLIGHSQGSLVAMLAASREEVSGVISIAGAARPIDEILAEQYGSIGPDIKKQAEEEMKAIKEQRESTVISEELKSVFTEENRKFLRTWIQFDPAKEVAKLNTPIYHIYGTSDSQVKPLEIQYFGNIIKDNNFKIINNMNHVLKVSPEDAKEGQKRYTDPSYPLHPELISTIVEFID